MKTENYYQMLLESNLHRYLPKEAIGLLINSSRVVKKHAKSIIFLEQDNSRDVYIILSGSVKIQKSIPWLEGKFFSVFRKSGEIFGETAAIEEKPRNARAMAEEDCQLLRMPDHAFMQVLQGNFSFSVHIFRTIVARIREYDLFVIHELQQLIPRP